MSNDTTLDQLLLGDSPAAERYRVAKAKHAELDLAEREKRLFPAEKVRSVFSQWSGVMRKMNARLTEKFGEDASKIVDEAMNECRDLITEAPD